MPEYKLIYFNMKARAELSRWCFAYGGIPYEDDRIEGTWAQRKKEMPGGQIPVLMVDGRPLTESLAIARYVAKQAGLVPQDSLQAAYCDAIVDTLNEIQMDVIQKYRFSKADPAEKQRIMNEELLPNKIKPVLNRLNERISNNDGLISEMTTWADLQLCIVVGVVTKHVPDLLKDYPNVSNHIEKIQALKPIKNWLSKRPVTDN